MDNILCDNCYHSQYVGYSDELDSDEFCLLFNKKLIINNDTTVPCEECKGKHFKLDD